MIVLFICLLILYVYYRNNSKYKVKDYEKKKKKKMTKKEKILYITQISILLTIEIVMCFTPFIGTIKIIPGSVEATIAFLPVIIGGIVLGPLAGGILGGVAGICSFIYWTFIEPGNLSAIMFTPFHAFPIYSYWTILICIVPRFLTGFLPGLINKYASKIIPHKTLRIAICCIAASLTNTLLVLFGTYFLWGKEYASAYGLNYDQLLLAIFTLIGTNGLAEAVFSTIVGIPVCKALLTVLKRIK